MFLCVFGGAWLALWAHDVFARPLVPYAVIALVTFVFFAFVLRIYRRHASAIRGARETQEGRRRSRGFRLVNSAQWLVIVVVALVLANTGRGAWIVPAVVFVIGAHFLPLARLFDYPPHYATGSAMMLLAATYPFAAPSGPASSAGCLGAGIILWVSAAWAITPAPSHHVPGGS